MAIPSYFKPQQNAPTVPNTKIPITPTTKIIKPAVPTSTPSKTNSSSSGGSGGGGGGGGGSPVTTVRTVDTPVYEDVLDTEKYQAYLDAKKAEFEKEQAEELKKKEAEVKAKQEFERKKTLVKEKLISAVSTARDVVGGINQALAKRREESYKKRQEKPVQEANVELQKSFETRKQKYESETESAKKGFMVRKQTGTKTTTYTSTYTPPVTVPNVVSGVYVSNLGKEQQGSYDVGSQTFIDSKGEGMSIAPSLVYQKVPATTSTSESLFYKVATASPSLVLSTEPVKDFSIAVTQADMKKSINIIPETKSREVFTASILSADKKIGVSQTIEDLRFQEAVKSYSTASNVLLKSFVESKPTEKISAVTTAVSSTTALFSPYKDLSQGNILGLAKVPTYVVGSTAVAFGGVLGLSAGVGEAVGGSIKSYYNLESAESGLPRVSKLFASPEKTIMLPAEYYKQTAVLGTALAGGVAWEATTGFRGSREFVGDLAKGTVESAFTDPIKFGVDFYVGGKVMQGVGLVTKPLTKPFTSKIVDLTTRRVVKGSERFVFNESRLLKGVDSFTSVGSGKFSFATQSKLGDYLYKRGFKFAEPKTIIGKSEYAFNVKEIYSTTPKIIDIKPLAQGTDDVTSYLIAKEFGVKTFGKVPKGIEKISFKTGYIDKIDDVSFNKLVQEKLSLAETFKSRTGFETEGIIKTTIGKGKNKVVSDVVLEKTTSDVFGLGKTKLKVGFEKQFIESPMISSFSTRLGIVEEKGVARVSLRGKSVEGGVGTGSQVIKLEGGGSGAVELKTFSPETKFIVKDTASTSVYSEYLGAKEKYQSLLGKEKPLQRYVSSSKDFGERNVLESITDKRFVPEGKVEIIRLKPSVLKGFKQKVSDFGFKIKNIKEYYTLRKTVGFSEKDAVYNIKTQQAINKQIKTTYPKGIPVDKTLKYYAESGIKTRNEQLALKQTINLPTETTTILKEIPKDSTKTLTSSAARVSLAPKVVQTTKTQTEQALQTSLRSQYQQTGRFVRTYSSTFPTLKVKQETITLPARQEYKLNLKSSDLINENFRLQQRNNIKESVKFSDSIKMKQEVGLKDAVGLKDSVRLKQSTSVSQRINLKESTGQSTKQAQLQLQKQSQLQLQKQSQLQLQKQQLFPTIPKIVVNQKKITIIKPTKSISFKTNRNNIRKVRERITIRKTKPIFQLKADLFRKFASAERDIPVNPETIKLRGKLWGMLGSARAFIPTKQLLEKNYIKRIGFNSGKEWISI